MILEGELKGEVRMARERGTADAVTEKKGWGKTFQTTRKPHSRGTRNSPDKRPPSVLPTDAKDAGTGRKQGKYEMRRHILGSRKLELGGKEGQLSLWVMKWGKVNMATV